MTLHLGDTAPDFEADTTEGRIKFHDWIGDSWAVLFSHPKDFTPVCTTELGYMANAKPDFDARGVKIIGLSVDALDNHEAWAKDIEETQGTAPNYPIISDSDFNVSKLYGMLPADTSGDVGGRTPADWPQIWRSTGWAAMDWPSRYSATTSAGHCCGDACATMPFPYGCASPAHSSCSTVKFLPA